MSIRVGEFGLALTVTTVLALTGATAGAIRVRSPDDGMVVSVDVTTEVLAAGAATSFVYTTLAVDPFTSRAGLVDLELEVSFGATKKLISPIGQLLVEQVLS